MDELRGALETIDYPAVRALAVLLASAVVAKITEFVMCNLLARLARRTRTSFDERLIAALHRPIFVSVVLVGVYLALRVLGIAPGALGLAASLLLTVALVVWTVASLRVCSVTLAGLSELSDRVTWFDGRTLPLFDNVARLVIVGGSIYFFLQAWDLNVGAWLASAGIVGIAVGFAAKDSLANLFGGLFIIVDAPYKIGDFITLDSGERGRVTKIGLRSTRLLTRDDVEVTLPNAQIANAKIVNESGGPWEKLRVAVSVGVAYGSDVDRVREVLTRAAVSIDLVADDPAPRIRFVEMGDSALIFRVMVWVEQPVLRGQCRDALNTAIYKSLKAAGISIPFPQRDVHLYRAGAE